jgi:hypothetical protein
MYRVVLPFFFYSGISSVSCFATSSQPAAAVVGRSLAISSNMVATNLSGGQDATNTQSNNMAQYLVDLHNSKATFDFCGGMMFQLVLSEQLKGHLEEMVVSKNGDDVMVSDATKMRMYQTPNYTKDAAADNLSVFHGREIRKVADAAGGMGMVLQLSLANANDPEGWTKGEFEGYDGWGHDSGRDWRTGDRLEQEGYLGFRDHYGPKSFALNHRFYLHYDMLNRLWLSAEDGCEGTPASTDGNNPVLNFFKGLL